MGTGLDIRKKIQAAKQLSHEEINMQTIEAARCWARTWAKAWPLNDAEAIVELQAEDGEHWASMFRPLHGRSALRAYLEECFAEETKPAETWFGEPLVDGNSASVEYWVVMFVQDKPMTVAGCTVLTFNDSGLVTTARDYSHVKDGYHQRPGSTRSI